MNFDQAAGFLAPYLEGLSKPFLQIGVMETDYSLRTVWVTGINYDLKMIHISFSLMGDGLEVNIAEGVADPTAWHYILIFKEGGTREELIANLTKKIKAHKETRVSLGGRFAHLTGDKPDPDKNSGTLQ